MGSLCIDSEQIAVADRPLGASCVGWIDFGDHGLCDRIGFADRETWVYDVLACSSRYLLRAGH